MKDKHQGGRPLCFVIGEVGDSTSTGYVVMYMTLDVLFTCDAQGRIPGVTCFTLLPDSVITTASAPCTRDTKRVTKRCRQFVTNPAPLQ